jgi:hypothetical protein
LALPVSLPLFPILEGHLAERGLRTKVSSAIVATSAAAAASSLMPTSTSIHDAYLYYQLDIKLELDRKNESAKREESTCRKLVIRAQGTQP